MSQQANITVFDGAATPVVHTFVGESVVKEGTKVTAIWKEALAGVSDNAQLRIMMTKEVLKSGVVLSTVAVLLPVMETVGTGGASGYLAPPKVANVERFEKRNFAHPRSIETNRRTARQILINLENNVSTTVTPVVAGPVAELFDKLVMVS